MNKINKFFMSLILGAVILGLLFKKINLHEIEISKISPSIVFLTLIFFFFIKLINSFRYSNIYKIKLGPKLFFLMCYSNMMLSLVPFRLGEFSYLAGLKKYFGKSFKEGAQKLILIRFADYLVVYLLLLVSSIYVSTQIKEGLLLVTSLLFIASLIIFFILIYLVSYAKLKINFSNKKLEKILTTFKEGISGILKISKKEATILLSTTLIYWLTRLVMGYLVLVLLGVNISIFSAIFASLFLLLIGLLPIQTFMNFGAFEAGWTYFLINLGYGYNQALPITLLYHLILMISPIFYGFLGFIFLKISNDKV